MGLSRRLLLLLALLVAAQGDMLYIHSNQSVSLPDKVNGRASLDVRTESNTTTFVGDPHPDRFWGTNEQGDTLHMVQVDDTIVVGSLVDRAGNVQQFRPSLDGATVVTPMTPRPEVSSQVTHKKEKLFSPRLRRSSNETSSFIDVMVLWTRLAECRNSHLPPFCFVSPRTHKHMRALVYLALSETNLALDPVRLRLVHADREDSYVETTSQAAIHHLSANYQDLRRRYRADLVVLLMDDPEYCGRGFYGYPVPDPERAFATVSWDCATGYYTFGHEIGHVLGCHHDRGSLNQCDSNQTNFGYRDGSMRDIMSVDCHPDQCDRAGTSSCPRTLQYSNPQFGGPENNCWEQIQSVAGLVSEFY